MREHGNILFLILLAVLLFAALAHAVTSSLRGGGKSASDENVRLLASRIVENAVLIENTMARAMLVHGVKDWEFDVSSVNARGAANGSCASDSCRIFSDKGGHVPAILLPPWASAEPTLTSRKVSFNRTSVIHIGTDLNEVNLTYSTITPELCAAINKLLGHTDIPLPATGGDQYNSDTNNYTGTLTGFSETLQALGEHDRNAYLRGKNSFCFHNANGSYYFNHVVIAR